MLKNLSYLSNKIGMNPNTTLIGSKVQSFWNNLTWQILLKNEISLSIETKSM